MTVEARPQPNGTPDTAPAPLFGEYDVVALAVPWPGGGLPAGVWGNVLRVNDDGTCHVEFTEKDGTTLLEATVAGHLLRLVWSEPE